MNKHRKLMVFILLLTIVLAVLVIDMRIAVERPKEPVEQPNEPETTVQSEISQSIEIAETPTPTDLPPVLEIPDLTPPEYDTDTVEALAKMVYGEARGCSKMEQAATVWCVLNRVDKEDSDILTILLAPSQFLGYRSSNPVNPEIVALVEDVLIRWEIEKKCVGDVGRVLPSDYLWFKGDGKHNYFRNEYRSSAAWDWSLPNPYDTEVTNK